MTSRNGLPISVGPISTTFTLPAALLLEQAVVLDQLVPPGNLAVGAQAEAEERLRRGDLALGGQAGGVSAGEQQREQREREETAQEKCLHRVLHGGDWRSRPPFARIILV